MILEHSSTLIYAFNAINFLLSTAFADVIFSFSFNSKYFSISPEISFLAHVFFRHMLLNLQIYGNFTTLFMLLISSLISFWSENQYCMISVLLNLQGVFYDPEWCVFWWMFIWAWEECVICCYWIKQSEHVSYIQLIDGSVGFNYVFTDFLPAGSVQFWQRSIKISNNSGFIYLYLLFYRFLPHILWHSNRFIHIKDCYISLEYGPLYHIMPLFIPNNYFHSQVWCLK